MKKIKNWKEKAIDYMGDPSNACGVGFISGYAICFFICIMFGAAALGKERR